MKSSEMLLVMRQNLISALKKGEVILLPILKFVMTFIAFNMLKSATGYDGPLSNIIVMIGTSVIGAFASAHCIEVCSILLVVVFLLPANPIMAIVMFIALVLIYILYGRLFPEESLLIIVTMIAFSIHLELLVPIIAAIFTSYASIIAIVLGVMIWFLLPGLREVLPNIGMNKSEILDAVEQLLTIDLSGIVFNQVMLIVMVVFFIVFSTIFLIRKLPMDYGPYIAIGIGAVMNILGFGLATIFFLDIEINLFAIVLETIVFSIIGVIAQFLSNVLDYQRAETVNFEDDDNYYYVRIVPKIKVNFKENKVKKVYTDPSQTNTGFNLHKEDDGFHSGL
ncbi:MAG: hypothetical protein J6F30_10920 [Cellulosilyticum sp.]|nr:hypothetical protein [Cellulosilyticum sp.]